MASENETIADIIAYLRSIPVNDPISAICAPIVHALADRIEAAWKREKAEAEAAALSAGGIVEASRHKPGNSAATREALKKIYLLAQAICDYKEEPTMVYRRADLIERTVNAALSAPARNCDLPLVVDGPADNNADKAWLVFKRNNPDAYFDVSGLLRCIDWLLAPAEEGGAK